MLEFSSTAGVGGVSHHEGKLLPMFGTTESRTPEHCSSVTTHAETQYVPSRGMLNPAPVELRVPPLFGSVCAKMIPLVDSASTFHPG